MKLLKLLLLSLGDGKTTNKEDGEDGDGGEWLEIGEENAGMGLKSEETPLLSFPI